MNHSRAGIVIVAKMVGIQICQRTVWQYSNVFYRSVISFIFPEPQNRGMGGAFFTFIVVVNIHTYYYYLMIYADIAFQLTALIVRYFLY